MKKQTLRIMIFSWVVILMGIPSSAFAISICPSSDHHAGSFNTDGQIRFQYVENPAISGSIPNPAIVRDTDFTKLEIHHAGGTGLPQGIRQKDQIIYFQEDSCPTYNIDSQGSTYCGDGNRLKIIVSLDGNPPPSQLDVYFYRETTAVVEANWYDIKDFFPYCNYARTLKAPCNHSGDDQALVDSIAQVFLYRNDPRRPSANVIEIKKVTITKYNAANGTMETDPVNPSEFLQFVTYSGNVPPNERLQAFSSLANCAAFSRHLGINHLP